MKTTNYTGGGELQLASNASLLTALQPSESSEIAATKARSDGAFPMKLLSVALVTTAATVACTALYTYNRP